MSHPPPPPFPRRFAAPGQGKTHTLSGYPGDLGLIPRAIAHLFDFLQSNSAIEYLVRVSYVEIYNEEIRDLLEPLNTDLRIFDDPILGSYVRDLKEVVVMGAEEALRVLVTGNEFRHVASTAMNAKSSRSHALFRMVLESRERKPEGGACVCAMVVVVVVVCVCVCGGIVPMSLWRFACGLRCSRCPCLCGQARMGRPRLAR
jgi:centromeric protein E